jgi:hypothetical protein
MSLPERIEPESNDPATGDGRADWLVGAEEGIEAELSRRERLSRIMPVPKLMRPGADAPAPTPERSIPQPKLTIAPPPAAVAPELPAPPAASASPVAPKREFPAPETGEAEARIGLPLPMPFAAPAAPEADDSGFVRGNAMTWEPGPSSVPTIRRENPMRAASVATPSVPAAREFPMDDAEERARVRAEAREQATVAAEASVRPHAVVAPDAFDLETVALPWWMQIPAQFKTDWRLQALLGVVLIALAAISFWPRGPQPESLGNVNRHPDKFDGHIITVAGKVGDVFEVGGGHAYYLLQRQDTLVVFTRGIAPRRTQKVTISGTVSTGYLDGQPHLALFELSKD